MHYGGYRYLLYKRWDYAPHGRTEEQKEALDAGKALFKAANFHHWATQPMNQQCVPATTLAI
jgi:hypothetical protein